MRLAEAKFGETYTVNGFDFEDEELESFLFTLGCYSGENIVVVSEISSSFVISIKDGRYNIDKDLAKAILVD